MSIELYKNILEVYTLMKDSGILRNAEPLVPEAMQVETLPTGEKYVQCRWCPCRFSNIKDFNLHVEALGKREYAHKENWRRK